ncbi:MAG TPA: ABC transporter substrate-binding protein [Ktedonobacteraceae bacterium]
MTFSKQYGRENISRRTFLQRAIAISLTTSSASTLLTGCGLASDESSSIDLITVWGGAELDSFNAVLAPFRHMQHITVNIESTRDLNATLTSRLRGNNPPDIAVLPNPGAMQQLASQNKLIRLDHLLDMNQVKKDYAQSWIDLGSYHGSFYGLFYKTANKGTVWYSPRQFQSLGYKIPTTWSEMLALSDQIASNGRYPWAIGVENGPASGWPASDWIAEIYLKLFGPEMYDKWVAHKIPWTHRSIKTAFQLFGKIASGQHYVNGTPQSIQAISFDKAIQEPFANPPQAYMDYLGDFATTLIAQAYPHAKAGTDYNFFPFPTLTNQYQDALTGSTDVVVVMKNTAAAQTLINYLATAEAQTIWVKRGGFTSPNKSIDLGAYPNAVTRASAQMLTSTTLFRYGAGDLMPPPIQRSFWQGLLTFIGDQSRLDSVLNDIESTAQEADQPV